MTNEPVTTGEVAAPAPATPAPRRRRRWRWVGLAFLGLLLVLLAAHGWWGRRAARGFSEQLETYRAAGDPVSLDELNAWPGLRRAGENAVPDLRAAAEAVDRSREAWKQVESGVDFDIAPPLRDDEVAVLEAATDENGEALRHVDTAAGKPGVDWDHQIPSPMLAFLYPKTDLVGQKDLSMLLRGAALLDHHRGDDAAALRRIGQILFLSEAVDHQPTVVTHLLALAVSDRATRTLFEIAPELRVSGDKRDGGAASVEDVRALIARLLDERPLNEGRRRSLVGERVMHIDAMTELAAGRMGIVEKPTGPLGRAKTYVARPYFHDNGRVMTAYMTAALRTSDRSPDLPTYRRVGPPEDPPFRTSRRYALAGIMVPNVPRVAAHHYRSLADRRMAAAALACRLYALDHDGRLPGELADLVPKYLPALPADPLAVGGAPLRYVGPDQDPQAPRVYSVGVNGVDNGGTETEPDPALGLKNWNATSDEVCHLKRQPRPAPAESWQEE